jgi:hypothetical protein
MIKMMNRYERKGISFVKGKEDELIGQFNNLANEKGGDSAAVKFLIEYYTQVAPIIGSNWETVANQHDRLEYRLLKLEELIKDKLVTGVVIQNEDGERETLEIDSFFG